MTSSIETIRNLADVEQGRTVDPGFGSVLAFEFYDGAETGLATYDSGTGVRFSSLGDSKSGQYRAFELCAIAGSWRERVKAITAVAASTPPGRFFLPAAASEELASLQRDVAAATAQQYFVGVGSPYLELLMLAPVSEAQLHGLRQQRSPVAAFDCAHKVIKNFNENGESVTGSGSLTDRP